MAKYKHHPDTLIVLKDLKNRFQQFVEISERTGNTEQMTAFQSARTCVEQAIDNGHTFRGNEAFPDAVEPYAITPNVTEVLIKGKE